MFMTVLIDSVYALKSRFHPLTQPAAKASLPDVLLTDFSISLRLAAPSKHWNSHLEGVTYTCVQT